MSRSAGLGGAAQYNTLQHSTTRCSTVQHVAAQYNTLQHSATRRDLLRRCRRSSTPMRCPRPAASGSSSQQTCSRHARQRTPSAIAANAPAHALFLDASPQAAKACLAELRVGSYSGAVCLGAGWHHWHSAASHRTTAAPARADTAARHSIARRRTGASGAPRTRRRTRGSRRTSCGHTPSSASRYGVSNPNQTAVTVKGSAITNGAPTPTRAVLPLLLLRVLWPPGARHADTHALACSGAGECARACLRWLGTPVVGHGCVAGVHVDPTHSVVLSGTREYPMASYLNLIGPACQGAQVRPLGGAK
jgi:hypothetical protein